MSNVLVSVFMDSILDKLQFVQYAIYFLYKVAWEEFMLRGEYAIYFSYKVVWGDVHTPEEDTINFSYKVV